MAFDKYVPDLPLLTTLCEQNYLYLNHLVPDWLPTGVLRRFQIQNQHNQVFQIENLETSRYTNHIQMRQISASVPAVMQPSAEIRVYHDARVAEVIKFQNVAQIKPSYEYPNQRMMHRDEKIQINRFLTDWLKHCVDHGVALQDDVNYKQPQPNTF